MKLLPAKVVTYLGRLGKYNHRHLSNIDCLMACTACLVCFIRTVMAVAKIKEKKPIKTGASSGHITNLKQSILETFDIHGCDT
jgi:hypothetical protein